MAVVERAESRVLIPGAEKEKWGSSGGPQNSVIAVLAVTLRLMGRPEYDYDFLMGLSGLAFRLQFYHKDPHGTCPSSPHAMVGSNCSHQAFEAVPFELEMIEPNRDDPDQTAAAFARVRELIDQGIPVMAYAEETDLILGYVEGKDVLLKRSYGDAEPLIKESDALPWFMFALVKPRTPAPTRDLAIASFRMAYDNAETPCFGNYASGWTAFEDWRRRLADEEWLTSATQKDRCRWMHANGFVYGSLVEARRCAVNYLRRVAPLFKPEIAKHVEAAESLYRREVTRILEPTTVPLWGEGKEAWTREQRERQIEALAQAECLERRALRELDAALAMM